jgi:cytochrome P450
VTLVSELDLPIFDYTAPDFSADSYHQQLAEIRRLGWLAKMPFGYIVMERDAGEFFLRAKGTAFPGRQLAEAFGVTKGPLAEHIDLTINNLEGEQHRRVRSLVGHAFSPRAADRWRPTMREFLKRLWQQFAAANSCEFVSAMAKPYPALTMAAVLGAPEQDAAQLREWSDWVLRQYNISAMANQLPAIERALVDVQEYVAKLLDRRRAEPTGDLISDLVTAHADGERLSAAECVHLVVNVLAGGIDTTQNQLAHAMRLFATYPGQWALLRRRPELISRAVTEVLRFEPVTAFTARLCTQEISYRDTTFPAGAIVVICSERANRETSEQFDITTELSERLLTFGAGEHYCLGANFARAELEEALAFLVPRMPGLELAGEAQLGSVEGVYGVDALPLRWCAGTTAHGYDADQA